MIYKKIGEINHYKGKSINPAKTPEQEYEVYSVPSFDSQYPEIIKGVDIGSSKQLVEKGDILLCKINPRINRVWVVGNYTEYPNIASSEWIVIRNKEYNPQYLSWYFRTEEFKNMMKSQVTGIGGSLTRAQPKCVKEYLVPIVNNEIQDKISQILETAHSLIDKRKQQIEACDDLIKSRFVEMFGDPVENPKGWKETNIANILSGKTSNGFFAKRDDYCDDGNVGVLGVANIVNRMYSEMIELPKTNAVKKDIDKYEVKYGDMLFCRSSLVEEGIGKASIVPFDAPKKILFECHVIRLQLDTRKCVPEYIQMLTTTAYFRNQVLKHAKTSTMTTIGQDGILSSMILLPPLEEQKKFLNFIRQVDKLKFDLQDSLSELEDNSNSLMQRAFKGELFLEN